MVLLGVCGEDLRWIVVSGDFWVSLDTFNHFFKFLSLLRISSPLQGSLKPLIFAQFHVLKSLTTFDPKSFSQISPKSINSILFHNNFASGKDSFAHEFKDLFPTIFFPSYNTKQESKLLHFLCSCRPFHYSSGRLLYWRVKSNVKIHKNAFHV